MSQSLIPTTPTEVQSIAKSLSLSGFFKDAADANKAFVKVLAGAELGLPAFQSMSGIHIVQGKPTLSSGLMAALIKRSGRYNYRVLEHSAEICRIEFMENGQPIGTSEMTMKEAKAANLHQEWDRDKGAWKDKATWKNFPKNMLFNRALSNGAKWHCPDIFGGPVYTEGEIEEEPVIQDTTAEIVHEAKPIPVQKNPTKRQNAQTMKHFQETGTLPADAVTDGDPAPDEKFVFDRIDEFTSNIDRAKDDGGWDWNEQLIADDTLISNDEKRKLIKASLLHRMARAAKREEINVVLERIKKFKGGLGQEASVVFNDLVEQANANGLVYNDKDKCFDLFTEPTNEQLSQALADNG